ncbi:hypothetical protein [Kibdelosporangium phytohabitans]|uniref:hypothetical protein n=1 Tax=Kibdelosporangium phytohabitans TaxID=860235 RepID=UPI0012FC1CBC|nr:hypothetical protein [Kibdelosporangium phytohabitans]
MLDQNCLDEITTCLTQIPDLLTELEVNATRQAKGGPRGYGSRSAETPLPYGLAASNLVTQITANLVRAATAVAPYTWRPPLRYIPPPTTVDTATRWLLTHKDQIRHHPRGEKLYDLITTARARALTVIDRPADLFPAGQCGAELDDGTTCPEILYGDPDRATVRCRCGAQHDMDRTWMLEAARDQAWTAAEIGRAIPDLTAAMVRGYANRRRLTACGSRIIGPGRAIPIYRVGDLLDILNASLLAG